LAGFGIIYKQAGINMTIEKFEDINVLKESGNLVNAVYQITAKLTFSKDFGLKDQIQRAAVSVMNNIAEGFERDNNRKFIRFLVYSKGSAGEIRSLLYVALDLQYIAESEFRNLYDDAVSIIKQISKFIQYLKGNSR